MVYLIKEEITTFTMGVHTKTIILGYIESDNEEEVKLFCKNKTLEIKGSYDSDRIDKTYIYEKISKLN